MSAADLLIDPEGEDLPELQLQEKKAHYLAAMTCTQHARDIIEPRNAEAAAMVNPPREEPAERESPAATRGDITVADSAANGNPTPFTWQHQVDGKQRPNLERLCQDGYTSDKTFRKILEHPDDHKSFEVKHSLIYYSTNSDNRVLCIPHSEFRGRRVIELVIDQAHKIVGHMGPRITANYVQHFFWWPSLGSDVKTFCNSCATCQAIKTSNVRPQGWLHSLPIPARPWSSIGMDFVGPFPLADDVDYIWVVLCRLTSLVHLIPLKTTTTVSQLAPLFLSHIVRLHRLPETIVSDRDPKFTSLFWTEMHRLLGIKLARSTAFHPQSNGTSERMIRKVSQVLHAAVRPDQLDWLTHLPMVEFALNSSVNTSTGFTPFELTYGLIPRTIQSVGRSEFAGVQDFVDNARDMVVRAHDALIESRVEQTHQANGRRRPDDPALEVGQAAYLSMENLNLPKVRARKLMPKYVGPVTSGS